MRQEIKMTLGIALGFVLAHFLFGSINGLSFEDSLATFQTWKFLGLVFFIGFISYFLEKRKSKRQKP